MYRRDYGISSPFKNTSIEDSMMGESMTSTGHSNSTTPPLHRLSNRVDSMLEDNKI